MSNHSFHLGGLHSLCAEHRAFLESLGLAVPAVLSREILETLVDCADRMCWATPNEMLRGLMSETLQDIKLSLQEAV